MPPQRFGWDGKRKENVEKAKIQDELFYRPKGSPQTLGHICTILRWCSRHPKTRTSVSSRFELLSDRWITENVQHKKHRVHYRTYSQRHPKHSRGHSNRPIADSMDTTTGNACEESHQS